MIALLIFNIEGCTTIESLNCSKNKLQNLNLKNNKRLKELLGFENELTTIDLSENKELLYFHLIQINCHL